MEITNLIIVGDPVRDVQELYPDVDPDTRTRWVEDLGELVEGGDASETAEVVNALLYAFARGTVLYLCRTPTREERKILREVLDRAPSRIVDEAEEMLAGIEVRSCTTPEAFEDAILDAMDKFEVPDERVVVSGFEEDAVVFHAPKRHNSPHTVRWCADGAIEVDGCILRHTAVVCQGHTKERLLGDRVLSPAEVLGFVASRLATNGVDDLVGYGRAFGPGKEDHTNATLTERSRMFRSRAVVGVVNCTTGAVGKAKPDMVTRVAYELRNLFPEQVVLLHQQCKEIYFGEHAVAAFRGEILDDGRLVLGGKSTKHARVDSGTYCLYTDDGDGYLRVPCVIGNFEEARDGAAYAPADLLACMGGYLKETVRAVRDFKHMTPELVVRYYSARVLVTEGQEIRPGDPVFEMEGVLHKWDTKADRGVVTRIVEDMTRERVEVAIHVDARFEGEAKIRGIGKALVLPMEAVGMQLCIDNNWAQNTALVLGAAGIIKDSRAASEYILQPKRVQAKIRTPYCEKDYEASKRKHQPERVAQRRWRKTYPGICTMDFDDVRRTVTTTDPSAIACTAQIMIEAAPVAQAVGASAMTMPQMAFLASTPTGNAWLSKEALPGCIKRIDALAYLQSVANNVVVKTRV